MALTRRSRKMAMNRRAFVTGLGAVLVAPFAAEAQQGRIVKIGYLGGHVGPIGVGASKEKRVCGANGAESINPVTVAGSPQPSAE